MAQYMATWLRRCSMSMAADANAIIDEDDDATEGKKPVVISCSKHNLHAIIMRCVSQAPLITLH